jgi:DNA polymerase III subunit gamma/tau
MAYEVVARRWRPLTFGSVVGQGHVTQTLANAVKRDRIPHAFLLTGTRGVGKTTIARLLARAINCTNRGESAEPCNECPSCRQNLTGSSLDIIEIDGASNTGVDDVRELIEAAQYRPSSGRFKVYIIDEVHQLSKSAFNALLKTLEEPPSHVKFVMATTEVHKLPATVLSRVQRYDFRRLTDDEIGRQLAKIAEKDGMTILARSHCTACA